MGVMSEWIEWGGGECPLDDADAEVRVRLRNGNEDAGAAWQFRWARLDCTGDIVAYRVFTPANDNHPQEDAFTPMTFVPAFDTPTTDVKAAIADEAKRIVSGARRSAYGKPESNFARIAAYWNAYAQCKGWAVVFTAADVSPMMRGMKEARLVETPDHRDSFVDMVGYTLTGAEVNGVAA